VPGTHTALPGRQARARGFPVTEISDHLADEAVTIWLDLRNPDRDDLSVLSEEFGLHPLAVEDAEQERQRPKLDRYRTHLFLNAYGARLDTSTGELATSELAAFITARALITVRKDDGLDIGAVLERWDAGPHHHNSPDLVRPPGCPSTILFVGVPGSGADRCAQSLQRVIV
jgi:magnesium transporter